jgi:hypothetical protein
MRREPNRTHFTDIGKMPVRHRRPRLERISALVAMPPAGHPSDDRAAMIRSRLGAQLLAETWPEGMR